jgi:hypothetical protein
VCVCVGCMGERLKLEIERDGDCTSVSVGVSVAVRENECGRCERVIVHCYVEQEVPAESCDRTCMMGMCPNHRGWGTASKARLQCWRDALGGPMDTAGESGSNHQYTARTTGAKN